MDVNGANTNKKKITFFYFPQLNLFGDFFDNTQIISGKLSLYIKA